MSEKYSLEFFDKTDDYDNISIFQDSRWSSNICWSFRINSSSVSREKFEDHCWWYSCWWQSCLWERTKSLRIGKSPTMVFKEFIRFLHLDNDQFVYFIFRGNIFYWVYYFQLWLQYSFKSITSIRIVVRCRVVIFFINKFFTFSLLLLWIDIFDILGNTWKHLAEWN